MEHSPSWEANIHSAGQEISPRLSWNLKEYYSVDKCPPIPRLCVQLTNKLFFYSEELLAPRPTPR